MKKGKPQPCIIRHKRFYEGALERAKEVWYGYAVITLDWWNTEKGHYEMRLMTVTTERARTMTLGTNGGLS